MSFLTLFEGSDSDFERVHLLSVQFFFGPDLSCGSIQLQPALSVTIQLISAHKHNNRSGTVNDEAHTELVARGNIGSQNESMVCFLYMW